MSPITQILHLRNERRIEGHIFDDPKWQAALDHCEKGSGFQRLYWGQSLEHPAYIELHIVRTFLADHKTFLSSQNYTYFLALIENFTSNSGFNAPFTGTAIYLRTTPAWHEGAWPLWTHIVREIDGCLGCSGGPFLEEVIETVPGALGELMKEGGKSEGESKREKFERSYIVYVGWQTTEQHHAYHHTAHFAEYGVILTCGNGGYAEYGHVVFVGEREGSLEANL